MKKKFLLIGVGIAACAVTAVVVTSCVKNANKTTSKVDETETGSTTETGVEEKKVTVSFNVDGGSSLENVVVSKGEKINEPTITREKTEQYTYTFSGWYINSDFSTKFNFNDSITENITLYAKWDKTVNKYDITWLDEDDSVLKTEKVEYGVIPSFTPAEKDNQEFDYTFVGWDVTPTAVTKNATYKAMYTKAKNAYNVIWMNGNNVLKAEKVEYGVTPSYVGANPTKEATLEYTYEFTGWTPTVDAVTGDVTYTATFKEIKNKYTITFKNGDKVLQSTEVEYDTMPSYNGETPTKASDNIYTYTFAGWNEEIVEVTGATTYTAKFDATYIEYTVKFVDYNDNEIDTKTLHYGDTITAPTNHIRENNAEFTYEFAGWDSVVAATVTGDVTYKATYTETKNKYSVSFNTQGGSNIDSVLVEYGNKVTMPSDPTLDGKHFEGWYKEADCINSFDFNEEITGPITLFAKWVDAPVQKYAVTFVYNNGTENVVVNINEGNKVAKPSNPTKEATVSKTFTFDDWYLDETTKFDFETPITADTTIYAKYIEAAREYTITWLNDDNSVIDTTVVEYGKTPVHSDPIKEATAKYTYTFVGWHNPVVSVTGEATYKATYNETVNKYTVTFKNGDTVLQSTEIEYDTMPSYNGEIPTKEATVEHTYTFSGWDKEIEVVTGDIVYTATFTETLREYTITWVNYDDSPIDTTVVKYGETPTHPTPVRDNTPEWEFTFVGWEPSVSPVTGETIYKATYTSKKRSYNVVFKNGDVVLQEGLVEYGVTPVYEGVTPTKEATVQYNYQFSGWTTEVSAVTGDVTYEAKFDSITRQYTYTFLKEDGTGEYKTVTADYGTAIIAPNNPSKASDLHKQYTFVGWFTEKTDGTQVTDFGTLVGNVAYYARFNEEEHLYTINWMDGATPLATSNNASYDTTYPNGIPTKDGYTFVKWEEIVYANTITRTAIFNENKEEYTVTWLNDDGSLLRNDKVAKNELASYGTRPSKSGYAFLYWAKDGVEFDLATPITSDITLKAVYGEVITIGFGASYTPWSELVNQAGSSVTTGKNGRQVLNTDVTYNGFTFKNNSKNLVSKDNSQYNTQGTDIIVVLPKSGSIVASASWASSTSEGYITIKNQSNEEVYKSSLIKGSGTNCSYRVDNLPAGTYTISNTYSVNYNSICYEVAKEYVTVSYVTNAGITIDPTMVVSGMTLDSLPEIQKDNYKLIGWYTDPELNNSFDLATPITSNITLYAKFEVLTAAEQATVTFASNVSGVDFPSITIEKGKTIVLPEQTVSGYRFDNWYTTSAHTKVFDPNTIINEDTTIYANYIKQWTITYKDKDGNTIATRLVDNETPFGEVAIVSAPFVEGYLFEYWECNNSEFTNTDDILSNITLVAHYKKDDGTNEKISITRTEGLQESAYVLFDEYDNATDYAIYEVDSSNNTKRLTNKDYYITKTNTGLRADLFGLKAGNHKIMIVPELSGSEVISLGSQTTFSVEAYDRSGYAHFNYSEGVGAYNDDGTLKDNAIVLYVTDSNKNSVELTYGGITVKGIGNILNTTGQACGEAGHETECKKVSSGKTYYGAGNTNQGILKLLAQNNIPLVVRFVGCVSNTGLYQKGTFNAANTSLINGLTAYDSNDYGGSEGDNGHMARMKSAKDVTLEGVGSDATIDGWGFHFMASSDSPILGKSFEVRNLKFINTPEDAVGMEGVQSGSTISASVERCWVHNNEFYCPNISSPAESDKSEGDGSCDFKRGMYFTCSYNYFEGCHKTNLVGSSDSSLQYNLTYHHNYWYLCKARGPLTRQANVHMYNNIFYGQTDYAMNTRANAYIFSESNLFYACKSPHAVESGAIKSYNDSISSVIWNKGSQATYVTDKNTVVSSNCAYNGVSYSSFELNSDLFYKDDYYLQADPTDAKKVIYARCGTAKASLPVIEDVTMSDISYVNEAVKNVTVNNLAVDGSTTEIAKLSKTIYAFKITESATATITYADNTDTGTGVLCNEAGVALLKASGTVELKPGTYFIQPYYFQPGDSKTLSQIVFKEIKNISIKLDAFDDTDYQNTLISEFNSLVNSLGTIEYNDTCLNKINAAYQKYEQLNDQSKASVSSNYNKLNTAYNTYKSKGISYVEGVINEIVTPVTEANANKVYAARGDYNELLQRVPEAVVSNYNLLVSAEAQLESIAVNLFLQKVEELPATITYTNECLEAIIAAEIAYESLTVDQKKLEEDGADVVAAYSKLVAARKAYDELEADANKVDVKFVVDGTVYSTSRITKNTKVTLPTNPTKSGYRFDNWYTTSTFTEKFDSTKAISSDTTIYARFVEQVTVTFKNMDGSTLTTRLVDKDGALSSSNIPSASYEAGYKFKYWSTSNNGSEFDFDNDFATNTTLYAVYEESNVNGIEVIKYGAEQEVLYAEFKKLDNFIDYNAYIKRDGDASYKLLDKQLIRQYSNYYRVDAVGLKAGTYSIKLVPFANSSEVTDAATEISNIKVEAHIRTGFGFVNGSSSGAYNDDGTLKSNAQVIYVTNSNKDSVSLTTVDKKGNTITVTGVQNIITNLKSNTKSKPLCIRILGNITDPQTLNKGDLYVDTATAGLTIEGIGTDATINGFGIVMKNSSNVEVRNLGFMNCNSSEGDSVGLQQGNDHCWVHNCDFFYGDAGSDADQVKGDGALDTKTSTYITHSFNHFFDTGKSNLQGMKSESTENYITYHHNWYDHSDSRHPRIRTCTVHIYNNYFDGVAKYGVGVTMGASAFVENNYFRSTATLKPMLSSGQGTDAKGAGTFSGETGGIIKAYGNTFDGTVSFISQNDDPTSFDAYVATSRDEKVPSTYKTVSGGTTYNNFDTNSNLMYQYDVESAADAKTTVTTYAGRVQGGDFKWTFNNSEDDAKYAVDNDLKQKLVKYTGTLVSVLGIDSSSQGGETPVVDSSVDDVIAIIAALPDPANVTLADTSAIYAARSEYQKLSTEDQAKVTNYSKLQQCIQALNSIVTTGSHTKTFDEGLADSTGYFTIKGNLNSKPTSYAYAGVTYTTAMKMESSSEISFTCTDTVTLTIVTSAATKNIKIDGTKKSTDSSHVLTITLATGTHTITKGDTMDVYAIIVE